MRYETLLYDLSGRHREIRLNRPQRPANAVTQRFYDELNDAFGRAEVAREVRVVLLHRRGRASASAPISANTRPDAAPSDRRQYLQGERTCRRLIDLKKPVVAAVNGYALGTGAEIALASDFC